MGRTSQTSCSQGQKTSHGGGSNNVPCTLCSQTFGAEKGLCPARGEAGLGASRHSTQFRRPLRGWPVAGRLSAGCKADGLCDPQLPVRPAPGRACRRARPRGARLLAAAASTAAPNTMESQHFCQKKSEVTWVLSKKIFFKY